MYRFLCTVLVSLFIVASFSLDTTYANTSIGWSASHLPSGTACPDEALGADGSHVAYTGNGVPVSRGATASDGSITCTTHRYYSSYHDYNVSMAYNNGGVTGCVGDDKTIGGDGTSYITCRKYDDVPPNTSDIIVSCPALCNQNVMTESTVSCTVTTRSNWNNQSVLTNTNEGSYITQIGLQFEQDGDPNTRDVILNPSYTQGENQSSISFSRNLQNVDNNRDTESVRGGRVYGYRITYLQDESGNKAWILGDFNGGVVKNCDFSLFANTTPASLNSAGATHTIASQNLSDTTNIADGLPRNLVIDVRDWFGNQIVRAPNIGRTIDFNWQTSNSMYLDQYHRTGDTSVFASRPDPANNTYHDDYFLVGSSLSKSLDDERLDADPVGTYTYQFKNYTPTANAYAGGGYSGVKKLTETGPSKRSDPDAGFQISNITMDINGTLGGGIVSYLIGNSSIDFLFQPLYYTRIFGSMNMGGLIEGAVQSSPIDVRKNNTSVNGTNNLIKIEYGGTESSTFTYYHLNSTSPVSAANPSNATSLLSTLVSAAEFPTTANGFFRNYFYSRLEQHPNAVGSISKTYVSTHPDYDITHPNGWSNIHVTYNSDIIGNTEYFSAVNATTERSVATQAGLRVIGTVATKSEHAILTNERNTDIKIIGDYSDKVAIKTQIRKNAYQAIRNANAPQETSLTITQNIDGNLTSVGKFLKLDDTRSIVYANMVASTDGMLTIGDGESDIQVSGNRTILVIGGNVYLKSNLFYENAGTDSLGIVILKDSEGNGGNLYIDPGVTNIIGNILAEKSLISYDGSQELDGATDVEVLANQLYIYGTVFSENTIGTSRMTTPKCPWYVTDTCTLQTAQKYDLNYLRRYYLVPSTTIDPDYTGTERVPYAYQTTHVAGGGLCNDLSGVCTGFRDGLMTKFTHTSDGYAVYPVIIEYDPATQMNPPPLFQHNTHATR